MACNLVTEISGNECIGDSRGKINTNFSALETAICSLSTNTINVVDTTTIDLDYTSSSRIISGTVKTDSIDSTHLKSNSVTTSKIASDTVRYSQLASWQTLSASPTLSAEAVTQRVAKAWGSIEKVGGTFTAYNSFNVLSVTDGGTKRKTVQFITPLNSNKYVVFITWMYVNGETSYVTVSPGIEENQTTSQFIINHYDETQPYTRINFVVFDY